MEILVVDDELSMREYLDVLLTRAGHRVVTAATVPAAIVSLETGRVDLVITDMKLGAQSGLQVLKAARALPDPPEVIVITAYGTAETAVQAMREGAYDYIAKPFDNEELKLLVEKALEKRALVEENRKLKTSLAVGPGHAWVSQSASMRSVWALVEKVAPSRSTVLIHGESGTGKELVARAIHYRGPRTGEPFLPINCAALNEGVLESELFGHMKGAFTGATQDRQGILVAAGEGTVFLDEIGEVPASMQVKLLRALQERTVKPVGGTQEIPFKARLVAATNKRLEDEVKAGKFREDLFYRLNVISIEVAPLRQRKDDIPLLANFFLDRMKQELARPGLRFSAEALAALQDYPFPGNVRQLQNIVERAATLSDTEVIGTEVLPPPVRGERPAPAGAPGSAPVGLPPSFSLEHHLDAQERQYLEAALAKANGVKMRAAELLGLTFRSFRYRLAKHGLGDKDDAGNKVEP